MTIDQIIELLTLITVVVSGLWVYFHFIREDPLCPRIEFNLDCSFFGPQDNAYVAAFSIYAHNKGRVEHKFRNIKIKAHGIKMGESVTFWEGHAPKLYFPTKVFHEANLVHNNYKYFFVRPGINQTFSFVTRIPIEFRFILVRATFEYENAEGLQTAERVFEVTSNQQGTRSQSALNIDAQA